MPRVSAGSGIELSPLRGDTCVMVWTSGRSGDLYLFVFMTLYLKRYRSAVPCQALCVGVEKEATLTPRTGNGQLPWWDASEQW